MTCKKGFDQMIDEGTLSRARNHLPDAQRQLYAVFADACFTTAYRITGDHAQAADICHDTFLTVFDKIGQFSGEPAQCGGWIKRIAVIKTLNYLRIAGRFTDMDVNSDTQSDSIFDEGYAETLQDLETLLTQLPTTARTVLWLYEVEGYSHKEIAGLFNKSLSFSKVTLLRAHATLKHIARDSYE
ncbi:RNA polymerase sigma factor [Glaciecola sp. 1036]|uniref:RNA polymerase sigma factor n=1 Tax=Alteromonadaceae TaxID=72275 RepID=UPI003D040EF9